MKTLAKFIFTLITVFTFTSCFMNRPLATEHSDNNRTYTVDYLFEHDGCRVYRFRDMGNYVYFTNCNGSVTALTSDSTRIQTITERQVYNR
ncbi:MAG: DUF4884 domain-containing protein [Bacteroidales bacterium]|nr:DUF4884 domain-containing protein [Bacteroidales bacterium]